MAATRRPLTGAERGRLLRDCLPFGFLVAGTIFVSTIWSHITEALAGQRTPLVFGVVMGTFLLVTGSTALNRVRDLLAGFAVVEQDHLKRLWRPRRGSLGSDCYGRFQHLGTLRMSRTDFDRAATAFDLAQLHHPAGVSGGRAPVVFRVTYSPASRIAWSVTQV
jgi:hypothetical protein